MRSSYKSNLHPCSVETAWPHTDGSTNFLCGQYELNEENNSRIGEISVNNSSGDILSSYKLDSGVLDMKWSPFSRNIACALSNSSICLLTENPVSNDCELSLLQTLEIENEGLILSIDRNDRIKNTGDHYNMVISTQSGSIISINASNESLQCNTIIKSAHLLCHEIIPIWIVAMNPHESNILFSGADDNIIKWWDLRTPSRAISLSKFHHTAGVTSGQWHPHLSHILATGSYDESILIWDYRNLAEPIEKIETGGGLWRIKWYPDAIYPNILTAACMHAGAGVFHSENIPHEYISEISHYNDTNTTSISNKKAVMQCDENSTNRLVYGVDWLLNDSCRHSNSCHSSSSSSREIDEFKIAICSFYDNDVQTWDIN